MATTEFTARDISHWSWRGRTVAMEWWLEVDGVTVGYMKTHLYRDDEWYGARFVICDIEVREGHRGLGHCRTMIEHAERETGQTLYTTGSFTPLGAAAFLGKMPVAPDQLHEPGVHFDDMTFVEDWDKKLGPTY